MAKRILVPLDQSYAAESVIPIVADAARGGGAVVRLLHVAPTPQARIDDEGRVIAYADQEMYRLESEAIDYLRAMELAFVETPTDSVVRFGDPLSQILREAEAFEADLIVVSTSGRSGLKRAMLGSVADQVFKKADVPVLLLRG